MRRAVLVILVACSGSAILGLSAGRPVDQRSLLQVGRSSPSADFFDDISSSTLQQALAQAHHGIIEKLKAPDIVVPAAVSPPMQTKSTQPVVLSSSMFKGPGMLET